MRHALLTTLELASYFGCTPNRVLQRAHVRGYKAEVDLPHLKLWRHDAKRALKAKPNGRPKRKRTGASRRP